MRTGLIDILSIITIIQLLLFSAFLFSAKIRERLYNKILSAFLFSNAVFILDFLLKRNHSAAAGDIYYLFHIGEIAGYLFGPLLYLYTKSLTDNSFKLKTRETIHFIPAILYSLLLLVSFHLKSSAEKIELLKTGLFDDNLSIFLVLLQITVTLFYLILSISQIFIYSKKIQNYYSSIEKLNLSWLKLVIYAFIFMWVTDIISFSITSIFQIRVTFIPLLTYISLSINLVFAIMIVFKGLKQEVPKETNIENLTIKNIAVKKYSEADIEKLVQYIEKEKPYLNPDLTLNLLAAESGFSPRNLSGMINDHFNKNFFDFINEYRINYSKILLKDKNQRKTVLEIIFESGFNTKSVFNTVFKKFTGLTPTQYRKQTLAA